ncbi:hypothetical protein MXB_4694 [Myxobolus squamalis]|nr:hypothetical protein MXB_4694 [Myxobolus squamalis]
MDSEGVFASILGLRMEMFMYSLQCKSKIISLSKNFEELLNRQPLNVHPSSHKVRALLAESSLKIMISLGSFYEIALVNAATDTIISHYKLKDFFPSLIEIDPARKILYLAGVDYEIKRFEFKLSGLTSMREVKRININGKIKYMTFENCVSSMKLFDMGEKIIAGFQSGSIHIYNTIDRKSEFISLLRHDSSIILLHAIQTQKLISMSCDGLLIIWDLQHKRTPVIFFFSKNL